MGFLKSLFGGREAQWREALQNIQTTFSVFHSLLDQQNQALKVMSRLEEKARQNLSPDEGSLAEIQNLVGSLIDKMVELGGDGYAILRQRFQAIRDELNQHLAVRSRGPGGDFVVPLDQLGKLDAPLVGTKNANLGELKMPLGLPVPDGFAITTRAYRHFLKANHLQERLRDLLPNPQAGTSPSHWEALSTEIRSSISAGSVPADLKAAIEGGYDDLVRRCPETGLALRSSAVYEDTTFTFAGQYVSFMNVRREELLDFYKKVLASQFAPAALAHFHARGVGEADLAMGVSCMAVVDAAASGVIYTRDPLNADGDYLVVHAVLGLGRYLVEGLLTPDVFYLSRADRTVFYSKPARKPVKLVLLPEGGVVEEPVPEPEQEKASIEMEGLRLLGEYALKVEAHYRVPQDIEWAIDRQGKLFLLQARPLRVIKHQPAVPVPPGLHQKKLADRGIPICPGAASGPLFQLRSLGDLAEVPEGVVLVAANPSPKLLAVMSRIKALVTEVGGAASHLATLAREVGLPTVAGIAGVSRLPQGLVVTVDATKGTIYEGLHPELIECRRRPEEFRTNDRFPECRRPLLELIANLSLINPGAPDFRAENCRSLHDIIRLIHQKAMEEMFAAAKRTAFKERIGQRLRTRIPLQVNVIQLEQDLPAGKEKNWIAEDEIRSVPLKALWGGVLEEGWPSRPVQADLRGFLAVVGTNITQGNQPEFSESSYAFLSREYMLLNLRMGYHFATIEALVTPDPIKNYIRMQYKEGGAPLDRRMRRIRLICALLTRMGFEHSSQGDFLDAILSYQDAPALIHRLRLLGRINIMTKQLDMALANDAVTQWYTDDFLKKLGLEDAVTPKPKERVVKR